MSRGRSRWLRLRALLAGGLVLGVGGAVTLAAWNDSEYASSTVTASTFGIEGSVNGGGWSEHESADGAAQLEFDPALPLISPGQSGFLQFSVRTTADATAGGAVSLQTPSLAGSAALQAALEYAVRVVPDGSACDAALFENGGASVIVPNGTALDAAVPENASELAPEAGNAVDYCVRISMVAGAGNDVQGESATATWQFLAEST
nr:SipW-dependent-type signal peptide-containing protein [Ruania zhangjianzhongii]